MVIVFVSSSSKRWQNQARQTRSRSCRRWTNIFMRAINVSSRCFVNISTSSVFGISSGRSKPACSNVHQNTSLTLFQCQRGYVLPRAEHVCLLKRNIKKLWKNFHEISEWKGHRTLAVPEQPKWDALLKNFIHRYQSYEHIHMHNQNNSDKYDKKERSAFIKYEIHDLQHNPLVWNVKETGRFQL